MFLNNTYTYLYYIIYVTLYMGVENYSYIKSLTTSYKFFFIIYIIIIKYYADDEWRFKLFYYFESLLIYTSMV